MKKYKAPGVYVEEISTVPAIAQVETAIPAFIGYTEKAQYKKPGDLQNNPRRISSLSEYEWFFGFAEPETGIKVIITTTRNRKRDVQAQVENPSPYLMYYSLQMYFNNGGGPCYIVSVGDYRAGGAIHLSALKSGLDEVARFNEVTLILFPDGLNISSAAAYYGLYKAATEQAAKLKNRFVVMDVWMDDDPMADNIRQLREFEFGNAGIVSYGAVYFPRIFTRLNYSYRIPGTTTDNDASVAITGMVEKSLTGTLEELRIKNNSLYFMAKRAINSIEILLPASPAVAGKYVEIDKTRGVWKAPANVSLNYASRPEVSVTDRDQENLNVDTTGGKSVNAIRSFPGRGNAIIWGARTLAGNDNEWRYISVRRFCNMVETSIKNATEQFVFYPNDRNTWIRVKSMIENYLSQLWREGALSGATAREAFLVRVGTGETMTEADVSEGRLIVVTGLAVIRPSEFILLRYVLKMEKKRNS
jgi:uncharacterized protein